MERKADDLRNYQLVRRRQNSMKGFELQDLIDYIESTKEENWIVDRVRDKDNNGCVMSHIFDFGGGDNGGGDAWDFFEGMWATTYMIYPVNDGEHPQYKQSTPKQRCIAYLKDLRDGKQKNTRQLMDEYEKPLSSSKEK